MLKPHHPPCLMVCLFSLAALGFRLADIGIWFICLVGAVLYAFIAISKYEEWESE